MPTRRTLAGLLVGAGLLTAAACGGSSSSGSSAATSPGGGGASSGKATKDVQLAYNADMQVPDPDIFYEIEGNSLVTSVYEGLVRYKPNSKEIEPALAESFTVSPDGLTYTFKLRPDVKFHDGTTLDSSAMKTAFERRTNVNSAPAYMLADVAGYETPDPQTFVVKLNKPVSAFLDYMAAPYGPKAVSQKVLTEQAGDDFAQSYLKEHDGGTGPFTITEFSVGNQYKVSKFNDYWGPKPDVTSITYNILPDISTQRLKFENGELSMIIHGLTASDIKSLESSGSYQVQRFPAVFKSWVMINPNKAPFDDQSLRQAVAKAIDREQIVKEVYGDDASVSTQIYPAGELPPDKALDVKKDTSALQSQSSKISGTLDIGYSSDDPRNQRVAELLQTQLQALGVQATTRGIPIAQVFDLPKNKDQAPQILVSTVNPDAVHPDTWARIFMSTDGALNWLQCSVPEADKLLDQGLNTTDQQVVTDSYSKAGDKFVESGCFASIADVKEVIVAQQGYSGWTHQQPTLFTVRFGDLKVGG